MAFVITAVTADVVTVASVAAAVGELGTTLSVVGAVTGNKDLSKAGAVMGLAGFGVGAVAGAADAAAGAGLDAVTDTTPYELTDSALRNAGDAEARALQASNDIGIPDIAEDGTVNGTYYPLSGKVVADGGAGAGLSPPVDSTASGGAAAGNGGGAGGAGGTGSTGGGGGTSAAAVGGGGANPPTPGGSFADGIRSWFKNPLVQGEAVKAAGAAAGGLAQAYQQSAANKLNQDKFNFQQQQYNTMMANANAQPLIAFQPVANSNPGIINAAINGGKPWQA